MAKDYTLAKEPACPRQQEPGPPAKLGGEYIISRRIDPNSVINREGLDDPDAPRQKG